MSPQQPDQTETTASPEIADRTDTAAPDSGSVQRLLDRMSAAHQRGALASGLATHLYSEAGLTIPAVAEALAVIVRAPPTRRRLLDGPPTFGGNSGEHALIGSSVILWFPDNASMPSSTWYYTVGSGNGVGVNFAQIVALSADFYGVYGDGQEISDQATQSAQVVQFKKAFGQLQSGNSTEMSQIIQVINQEITGITVAATVGQQPSTYYLAQGDSLDVKYNRITGGGSFVSDWIPTGRYLDLASTNWDHFAAPTQAVQSGATTAYQAGHLAAVQTAAAANGNVVQLNLAYAMEAYACHYLTDLFASGHLRAPRRPMYDDYIGGFRGNLAAKAMHDQDNSLGLFVTNSSGNAWKAFGDGHYYDTMNRLNRQIQIQAVQTSVNEVAAAFQSGSSTPAWAALNLTPNIAAASAYTTNGQPPASHNFSQLYIGGYTNSTAWVKARTSGTDVNVYQWQNNADKLWLSASPTAPAYFLPAPTGKITVDPGNWAQPMSPSYGPNWAAGNQVRYGVSFVNAATNEESPICWGDWIAINAYAFAGIQNIPAGPSTANVRCTGRLIYRQFVINQGNNQPYKLGPVQVLPHNNAVTPNLPVATVNGVDVTLNDNTSTTWSDWNY